MISPVFFRLVRGAMAQHFVLMRINTRAQGSPNASSVSREKKTMRIVTLDVVAIGVVTEAMATTTDDFTTNNYYILHPTSNTKCLNTSNVLYIRYVQTTSPQHQLPLTYVLQQNRLNVATLLQYFRREPHVIFSDPPQTCKRASVSSTDVEVETSTAVRRRKDKFVWHQLEQQVSTNYAKLEGALERFSEKLHIDNYTLITCR